MTAEDRVATLELECARLKTRLSLVLVAITTVKAATRDANLREYLEGVIERYGEG